MVETEQKVDTYINIFSYGSNHPKQLSERLGTPLESIMERAFSCTLYGWDRVYEGKAKTWGG
jgi:hypothetical protein